MASLLCRSPRSAAEWRYFFTVKRASLLTRRRVILARLPSSSSSLFRVSLASALASLSLTPCFLPSFCSFLSSPPFSCPPYFFLFLSPFHFSPFFFFPPFFQIRPPRLARVLSRHPETKKGDSHRLFRIVKNVPRV